MPGDGHAAADTLSRVLRLAAAELGEAVDADWSSPAGTLDWTCRQTVDHLIDCLFSYALQLSARSPGPFLPLAELHALAEATNEDLVSAFAGVGELLCRAVEAAPDHAWAGDGLVTLDAQGWARRGAYEVLVHVHDVLSGLGRPFAPAPELCSWVMASAGLWMLDRGKAARAGSPWVALLLGSGRPGPS